MTKEELFQALDEYYSIKYYSITETAKILGVSRGTVYNMLNAGELNPSIIHGQTKFSFQELNKFNSLPRSAVKRHVRLKPNSTL